MVKLELASWWDRFEAIFLDGLIFSIPSLFLSEFVYPWLKAIQEPGIYGWNFIFFVLFVLLFLDIIIFLYFMVMEGIYGQSLGKMKIGIKVVQTGGGKINMKQAAIESFGKSITFLVWIDFLLGCYLYPGKKQRLFNHLSNTIVVKT